jgi:hypothetical protein
MIIIINLAQKHDHQSAAKQNIEWKLFLTNLHTIKEPVVTNSPYFSLPRARRQALNSPSLSLSLSLSLCTLLWIVSMSCTQMSFPFMEAKDREVDFCPSIKKEPRTYLPHLGLVELTISAPWRMDGWIGGWMDDVWTGNSFSLYSCTIVNHNG